MGTVDLSERELNLDGSAGALFRFLVTATDSGGPVDPTGWTTETRIYWRDGTQVDSFTTFWTGNVLTVEMSAADTLALGATGQRFRWVLLVNDVAWLGGAFTLSHLGFDPTNSACGAATGGTASVLIEDGTVLMSFTGVAAVPNDVVRSTTVDWIETLTQAAYNLIPVPSPQTVYIIIP